MRRVIFDSLSFICLWLRLACARLSDNRDVAKIKVGTHLATSCSNTLQRQVAATNSVVCAGKFLWKSLSPQHNFVAARSRKKSNQTEFVRLAFCCCDKTLLQRQRFSSQKFSYTHEGICRCDVSP